MELKILIKNTYHLASAKLVRFVIGLIRAKFNAVFLGTSGLGIVSQILFINGRFNQFALLGMNDGLVKQLASKKGDVNFRELILNSLKSYFIVISFTTIITLGISLFFSKELTIYFFGDESFYSYYLISIICLPLTIINTISFALLKTFKLINKMARAELISAVITFVFFVPMVYFFQLKGAVIVIVINLINVLLLNHYFSKKSVLNKYSISYKDVLNKGKIISADIKELIMFGGYGLTLGLYMMLVVIVRRSVLIDHLGISSLGLYAPNIAWGGLFTGLLLPTIRHYLYPRFSEIKIDTQIVGVLNDAFRLTTFLMLPFLFGGIAFRSLIIPLFYSTEFIGAANYLPGHFLGMLFMMWSQIFVMMYTPTGRIKFFVILQFILQSIDLGLVFYLIPKFGLYGYMISFSIVPILFIIVSYIYLNKAINLSIINSNKAIMFYLITFSGILYGISEWNSSAGYVIGIMLILLSWYFLKSHEQKQILIKIKSTLNGVNK